MRTLLKRTQAGMIACIVAVVGAVYVTRIVYGMASNPPSSSRRAE